MRTCTHDLEAAFEGTPAIEPLEGEYSIDRYGITVREELAGEPLDIALAQEEPEVMDLGDLYDEWALADEEWETPSRLDPDVAPETRALHLVLVP